MFNELRCFWTPMPLHWGAETSVSFSIYKSQHKDLQRYASSSKRSAYTAGSLS